MSMKKQALLIGINKYKILPELKYARQDAEAVADSLKKNYCFSDKEILLLTDDRPGLLEPTDRYIIHDHLEKLANQELDLFIFGFWGHGLFRNGQRYFCPLNVKKERTEIQGLPFDELQDLLARIRSKNTCMILDCCQTVHDRGEAETLTAADQNVIENAARDIVLRRKEQIPNFPSNVAILNSCKAGQCAYEWDERKHGLFTALLLDAMKKRSASVMQIASYISSNIEKTALELGKDQTPFYKIEGDIVLPVNTKPASSEPVQSSVNENSSLKLMHVSVPENVTTIAEAYNIVKDGGVITIQPGKYELLKTIKVNRSVTFRGSTGRAEDVVVDCPSSDAFSVSGGNPSFQNITVSSGAEMCGGFSITGGSPKLFRCIITSRKGAGMYIKGNNINPQVESCVIKYCGESGVYVYDKGLGTFKDCEIYGNVQMGIEVGELGAPTFIGCEIHDGKDSGVYVYDKGRGLFKDCEIFNNQKEGIDIRDSGNPTFSECKIYNGKKTGVYVHDNGLGSFIDCEIYRNVNPGIVVKTSGNPTVSRCKIYDGKNAGVYVLDNGLGAFSECSIYKNSSPGIEVKTSGNPTVRGCKIFNGEDAGVYVHKTGLGSFVDCEIYRNAYSGIAVETSGNPTVTGCLIRNGKSCGVWIHDKGMGTFNNNVLEDNILDNKLDNWHIERDAGSVKGSRNNPPIPMRWFGLW